MKLTSTIRPASTISLVTYATRRMFSTLVLVGEAQVLVEAVADVVADLVMMSGLLHHLDDDEAITALRLARASMAPGSRLVCLGPCFLLRQAPLDRWLVSRDRGKNVRYESEWKRLLSCVFDNFDTHILTGHIRIPYSHILIEARKP